MAGEGYTFDLEWGGGSLYGNDRLGRDGLFIAGTKDIALGDAEALHPWLSARGIPHEYEILLAVGHDARAYDRRSGLSGFRFHFVKP